MFKFKKIFICFMLSVILVSSCVFATNTNALSSEEVPTTTSLIPNEVNKDLYIYNTDSYSVVDKINGNVFASTTKLTINPRNNGGYVSGDIFAIANEFSIESDAIYSNNKDKNGNYIIDSITAKSIVYGNVYALVTEDFTLEAGSEINGDLYIVGANVNIEQDAVISGNLYVSAENVTFNGQLNGSAYVSSTNFTMKDFAYIARDLYLNSENATLTSVVYRNAYVTVNNKLTTLSDFIVYQNLSVDFANDFKFSGEVVNDAYINAKSLTFKNTENDTSVKCSIKGNLNYGCDSNITIPDGIVLGETTKLDYVDNVPTRFSLTDTLISLVTFLIYVFVIVLLAKFIAPKAIEKLPAITFGNIISSLIAGLLSFFVIFVVFVLLLLSGIGVTLSLALIVAYLFVFAIALPIFMLDIAKMLKMKLNIYFRSILVGLVLYLISLIPVLGSAVMFVAFIIAIGRILLQLFSKKK